MSSKGTFPITPALALALSPFVGLAAGLLLRSRGLFLPTVVWLQVLAGLLFVVGMAPAVGVLLFAANVLFGRHRGWTLRQCVTPAVLGAVVTAVSMGGLEYVLAALKLTFDN